MSSMLRCGSCRLSALPRGASLTIPGKTAFSHDRRSHTYRQYASSTPCSCKQPRAAARSQTFRRIRVAAAAAAEEPSSSSSQVRLPQAVEAMDANQLQTALVRAINAEDYDLARVLRDHLSVVLGAEPNIDWNSLDLPEWLVDRAERLGFRFPTEIQQRAARVILSGADAVLQSETGSGKTLAFLLPAIARLDYPPTLFPEDLDGPQLLVVVPTFELGVQAALLVYKLYGGSINSRQPGDPANMFTYTGPRRIQVKGLLRDDEVDIAKRGTYLSKAHVVVTTPQHLVQLMQPPNAQKILQDLKVVVIDEVDECFKLQPEATMQLLASAAEVENAGQKTQIVFVGATVKIQEVALAMREGWLRDPIQVSVGNSDSIPAGLQHRYVVCDGQFSTPLSVLTRMLRQDLQEADKDVPSARVIVFANSEQEAKDMSDPLRTVLWEEHRLSVLLPSGSEPVTAMHAFRDNLATLLLCTPAASRGLDLPAVSHVYNVGPPCDATEYLHRAGRAGRIGATTAGIITTIVTPDQEQQLLDEAKELGIQLTRKDAPKNEGFNVEDTESARKGLEDLFNLF